jgi:hypothetical protein
MQSRRRSRRSSKLVTVQLWSLEYGGLLYNNTSTLN